MHKGNASAGTHQRHDCSHARWRRVEKSHAEYGMPDIHACARVDKVPGADGYPWSYSVSCAVKHRQVQGHDKDADSCVDEAVRWLGEFNCPGKLTKQEKTWKQWAMIGQ